MACMAEPLSKEQVFHVALLARLRISSEEAELYASQLSTILKHAEDIESLDLDDVPPTSHPSGMSNVLRKDEIQVGLTLRDVLSSAPEVLQDMFSVPPIMGEGS